MSLKSLVASLAIGVSLMAFAADPMGAQATVETGKWCSDYPAARAYAEANNIPMLVFWASPDCGQCKKLETACKESDFLSWQAQRQLVMVFAYGKDTPAKVAAYNWIRGVENIRQFPFIGVYWKANGAGQTVESVFVGRNKTMPVTTGTLQAQLMASVDKLLAGWSPSGDPTPPPHPSPAVTHKVTFVVDATKATYEGALVQGVEDGKAATAPVVMAKDGWNFTGWDKKFTKVTSDLTVTAKFAAVSPDVRKQAYGSSRKVSVVVGDSQLGVYIGTATASIGKLTKKNQIKVTVKATLFTGKAYSASKTVDVEMNGSAADVLKFKSPLESVAFKLTYDAVNDVVSLVGLGAKCAMESTTLPIGGKLAATELTFNGSVAAVATEGYDFVTAVTPIDEPVYVKNGTKFSFDKYPTLKYKKITEKDPETRKVVATYYELQGLDDPKKPNVNALKITYKNSSGIFSGSFYTYISNAGSIAPNKKPTLKKCKAAVNGAFIDGVGYGTIVLTVGKTKYNGSCIIK